MGILRRRAAPRCTCYVKIRTSLLGRSRQSLSSIPKRLLRKTRCVYCRVCLDAIFKTLVQDGRMPVDVLRDNKRKTPKMMKALGYATNELHKLLYNFQTRKPKPFVLDQLQATLKGLSPEDAVRNLSEKDDVSSGMRKRTTTVDDCSACRMAIRHCISYVATHASQPKRSRLCGQRLRPSRSSAIRIKLVPACANAATKSDCSDANATSQLPAPCLPLPPVPPAERRDTASLRLPQFKCHGRGNQGS